jgi:radical SAM superfamily enzyme YgiQ (UPF0313 family)
MKYDVILFTDMNGKVWHSKPLGAYRLATELRKNNYSVKVIDWFSRWLNEPEHLNQLLNKIIGENTLFIGFSTVFFSRVKKEEEKNSDFYNYFFNEMPSLWPKEVEHLINFTNDLKRKYPNTKLVAGGINNFSGNEYSAMQNNMDYIIHGLSDSTIVELANHLKFKTKIKYNITGNKAKQINHDVLGKTFNFKDSQVTYNIEDNVLPGEILTLETSRGCLFKCDFCSFPLIGRKKGDIDYHKTESSIMEELVRNYNEHQTTRYMFVDDTFNETTNKIQTLLKARDKAKINIEFSCYLRADLLERFPEQIILLKELGIRSGFLGIESLNEVSAKAIGKGTHPDKIKEVLYKIKDSWKDQANILGSFIIGLPGDNPETLEPWINWIERIDNPIDSVMMSYLSIIKNDWPSQISRNPEKYGYTITNIDSITALKGQEWKNKHWTSQEARKYVNSALDRMWKSGRLKPAGWDTMGLLNLGYDFDYINKTSLVHLDYVDIQNRKNKHWTKYKKMVMEQEKIWNDDDVKILYQS